MQTLTLDRDFYFLMLFYFGCFPFDYGDDGDVNIYGKSSILFHLDWCFVVQFSLVWLSRCCLVVLLHE